MDRRRESLGRNRPSSQRPKTLRWFVLGIVLLSGAGIVALKYFTQPERVYGARQLDCPATSITWEGGGEDGMSSTVIRGCGRSVGAICDAETCYDAAEENLDEDLVTF